MERQPYEEGLFCYIDQYRLLKQCSEQRNTQAWNDWRNKNPNEKIKLCGAEMQNWDLARANLIDADFTESDLTGAILDGTRCKNAIFAKAKCIGTRFFYANCEESLFLEADLSKSFFVNSNCTNSYFNYSSCKDTRFTSTDISNSEFFNANLEGTWFVQAKCYNTNFLKCYFSNLTEFISCFFDNNTTISDYLISTPRTDIGTRIKFEHNCRIHNWNEWYKNSGEFSLIILFVKFFWYVSDYGNSTKRILAFFSLFIFIFTFIYYLFPQMLALNGVTFKSTTFFTMLTFACSTMVTLGFSNINVSVVNDLPNTWGMLVVSMNLIVGYFMLAVLVTRLGILFQSLGPGYVAKKKKAVKPK
ncbi:Pentapeptide repeat [anaerobic digester metagenome]